MYTNFQLKVVVSLTCDKLNLMLLLNSQSDVIHLNKSWPVDEKEIFGC